MIEKNCRNTYYIFLPRHCLDDEKYLAIKYVTIFKIKCIKS